MKKSKALAALLISAGLITANVMPAMADSVKVVTLGADLTQEQKDVMMRYFKVNSNEVQILSITNQDERDHLSAYVPLEQIGTRTVSCAYVKPTQSGGIKVRTANLNWVTCNMIATSLSTSGVKNCEVVAACPFEVSGTGALTGIQMAYEQASGQKLDETKKQIATEEMVVTGKLADNVGQNDATIVVNQSKMEVIQNNIQDADQIYNVVQNIAQQNNISISSDQLDQIVSLLQEIAQQNYNYEDVKDTLERVDDNVTGETTQTDDTVDLDEDAQDSIVDNVDDSVLGDDVIQGSTEDPSLGESTSDGNIVNGDIVDDPMLEYGDYEEYDTENTDTIEPMEGEEDNSADESGDSDIIEDPMTEYENSETDDMIESAAPEAEGEASGAEDDAASLSEQALSMYYTAKNFCAGEYEGDIAALQEAAGEDAYASVTLDSETGKKLSEKVEDMYLNVLSGGANSYAGSDEDVYMSTDLNMVNAELKKLFSVNGEMPEGEDVLMNVSEEDKQALYKDTLAFFEKMYGESSVQYEDESAEEYASYAEEDGSSEEEVY